MTFSATANGDSAVATGVNSNANGQFATTTGGFATANGAFATATGAVSFADGAQATATGVNAFARIVRERHGRVGHGERRFRSRDRRQQQSDWAGCYGDGHACGGARRGAPAAGAG